MSEESDAKILNEVQERFDVNITELPDEIELSSYIEGRWNGREKVSKRHYYAKFYNHLSEKVELELRFCFN